MQKSKRELRSERHLTDRKGTANGKCVRQHYFEKVLRVMGLPDGRMINVIRGYTKYLHVTKRWKTRMATGLKYEIASV